ncbi:MAG: SRPBCC family protein [Corynebacteriales bacterium]|nr:SRPBCC family protein [Mycobacteriales bacterium]
MAETQFVIEPSRQDIVITRAFNAPKDIVFEAFTNPEHIPNWWGPAEYSTVIESAEMRPGGSWRYIQQDKDGNEYGFRGVYHDVVPNERIVSTFEFEGVPGHVALETVVFTEVDGVTTYNGLSVFQSIEDRDGMVASGMREGFSEGMDRLEALIEKLQ